MSNVAIAAPVRLRFAALRAAPTAKIDREKGIIPGYAVISRGEALGHNMWVDAETLQQVAKLGNALQNGIKSRYTHPGICSDAMGTQIGRTKTFNVVGDLVRADLHIYQQVTSPERQNKIADIMDLADEDPESFGASIVFQEDPAARDAFIVKNGGIECRGEYGAKYFKGFKSPDPQNTNNFPHVRIAQLQASDIVGDPAANPSGFFSEGDETAARAEAVCLWLFGKTQVVPDSMSLGGMEPSRVQVFFKGFLDRHNLEIATKQKTRKEFVMPKCPECNHEFEDPATEKDITKPEEKKEELGKPVVAPVVVAPVVTPSFSQGDVTKALEEGRKAERAYTTEFEGVMTAAQFKPEEREAFRTEYHGQDIANVKKFAALKLEARSKPVGEGGAGGQQDGGTVSAEVQALEKRFSEDRFARHSMGVHSDDPKSDEWKSGMKRYVLARQKIDKK